MGFLRFYLRYMFLVRGTGVSPKLTCLLLLTLVGVRFGVAVLLPSGSSWIKNPTKIAFDTWGSIRTGSRGSG